MREEKKYPLYPWVIIKRAAELWVRLLRNPHYNNGDPSGDGFTCSILAHMIPKNNDESTLERFRQELETILACGYRFDRKKQGDLIEIIVGDKDNVGDPAGCLAVDYGPDLWLAMAARRADLKMEFPWKVHMYIYETHVSMAGGYRNALIHHYPFTNGDWLVTTLTGSPMEIEKIKDAAQKGAINLTIERADSLVTAVINGNGRQYVGDPKELKELKNQMVFFQETKDQRSQVGVVESVLEATSDPNAMSVNIRLFDSDLGLRVKKAITSGLTPSMGLSSHNSPLCLGVGGYGVIKDGVVKDFTLSEISSVMPPSKEDA